MRILHEVLVASRRAFVPMPDTRVIERPGWMQLLTPSLRDGGMNEVLLAVLSPDEADAVIDETLACYREQRIRFRWTVGPDSAPPDLVDRLQRRGLQPQTLIGLACAIEPLVRDASANIDAEVVIERVTETNIEEFTHVMARGWAADPAPMLVFHRRILALAGDQMPMHLARLDGQPAGAAAVALLQNSAYLMGAVVLPEQRGRGLYRALVASRARVAAARGLTLATSHANEATSAPILRRLGFHEVCRMTMLGDSLESLSREHEHA